MSNKAKYENIVYHIVHVTQQHDYIYILKNIACKDFFAILNKIFVLSIYIK